MTDADAHGPQPAAADAAADAAAEEWLTAGQAAQLVGRQTRTVYSWMQEGRLQALRAGRVVRTTRPWVVDFLRRQAAARHPHGVDGFPASSAQPGALVPIPAGAPLVVPLPETLTGATDGVATGQQLADGGPWVSPNDPVAAARFILGPGAPEDGVAALTEAVQDYHRHMARLHPQTRLLLVQDFFSRVRRSAARLEALSPGLLAAPCGAAGAAGA